jgi:SAM-dependent methyltransferase
MRFTKNHKNRKAHNWLIYDCYERVLLKKRYTDAMSGVLYDLGAGESPYKDFFMVYVQKYIAVDWTSSTHDVKADILADLNQHLPIESEVADTVVSLSVMEHLNEPFVMLSEAFRILKSRGTLILQVPWQWWIHEDPYDFFRYTPYGLKYLLEKAGFVDVVVEPQSGFFTMWFLKFNYFSLRLIRGPRLLRWLIKALLMPIWYLNQKAAPYLDKLDRNWAAETSGYFVTAKKL